MAAIPNEVKTIKVFDSTAGGNPGVWRVELRGSTIGYIERYRDSMGFAFPWIATDPQGRVLDKFTKEQGYLNTVNEVVRAHFQAVPVGDAAWTPQGIRSIIHGLNSYEAGELDHEEEVQLFRDLIKTGIINHLQGSYQRKALRLVTDGELP